MSVALRSAVHEPPSAVLHASELVCVGRFRCPTNHPRFNDSGPTKWFCFVFPRTAVWIEHEGSAPFVADANVIPLYNRGRPYQRRAISRHGDRTDWFAVAPGLLREMLARYDLNAANDAGTLFRFGYGRATPRIYAWQRAVFDTVATGASPDGLFVEESVVGLLSQVLQTLYGAPPPISDRREHRAIVEETRAHLAGSYAGNESLADIARATGVSVFHLCRLFRRLTGRTLHGYRGQLRLHRALEQISDGTQDLLGLATDLGYSGHSHFTAAFRAAFGTTPSEWRATGSYSRAAQALADCAALSAAPALRR